MKNATPTVEREPLNDYKYMFFISNHSLFLPNTPVEKHFRRAEIAITGLILLSPTSKFFFSAYF